MKNHCCMKNGGTHDTEIWSRKVSFHTYYTPKFTEFQGVSSKKCHFCKLWRIFMYIVLCQRGNKAAHQSLPFSTIWQYLGVESPIKALNIVFAIFHSLAFGRVNIAYPLSSFVQLNYCVSYIFCNSLPFYGLFSGASPRTIRIWSSGIWEIFRISVP